ncbi:MAG: chemotaxis protein CheW [Gammaproteobacteria bacterium]|jgi:twitching motility protein PilI
MLPSEALNREFVVPDAAEAPRDNEIFESRDITAHGVLVGNIGLLLPRREVSELVNDLAVCQLPNTSSWFDGVASVRGNMIPVFDMHLLFDIAVESKRRRMIIVGEDETAVAFWVDEMPRMVALTAEDSMTSVPPIPPLIRDHSRKYYLKDGQIWVDWDVKAFFTTLGNLL